MVSLLQALCIIFTVSQVNVWGLRCYCDTTYLKRVNVTNPNPMKMPECSDNNRECYILTGLDVDRRYDFKISGGGEEGQCKKTLYIIQNNYNPQIVNMRCIKVCSTDYCNDVRTVDKELATATATATATQHHTTPADHKSTQNNKSAATKVSYSIWVVFSACLIIKF